MSFLQRLNPFGRRNGKSNGQLTGPTQVGGLDSIQRHLPRGSVVYMRELDLARFEAKSVKTQELFSNWLSGRPEQSDWSFHRAIEYGYKASSWVFACMFRYALSAGTPTWYCEERKAGKWVPTDKLPDLQRILDKPNPVMTMKQLVERATLHLHAAGDFYWAIVRNGPKNTGDPWELWPLGPDKVEPIPDRKLFVKGYQTYQDGRPYDVVEAQDMVHGMLPDPENPRRGLSTIECLKKAVDTDSEASSFQMESYNNRAVPSGAMIADQALSPDQHAEGKSQFREEILGPENARVPLYIGNNMKWVQLSNTPVEMDFLNSRKFTLEEICSGFQTSPVMIGYYEKATLSNIQTARLIYWLDTILPFMRGFRDTVNLGLVEPNWGPDVRANFSVAKVDALRPLLKEMSELAKVFWGMGVPFNILNEFLELGIPEFDGWDVGFIPSNMVPIGSMTDSPNSLVGADDE